MLQFGTKFNFFQRHRVGKQHVHELAVDSTCRNKYTKKNPIGSPLMSYRLDKEKLLCPSLILSMYSASVDADRNKTEITQSCKNFNMITPMHFSSINTRYENFRGSIQLFFVETCVTKMLQMHFSPEHNISILVRFICRDSLIQTSMS